MQVIFRERATNYRALLWKMTCGDKASYGSWSPYMRCIRELTCLECIRLRYVCVCVCMCVRECCCARVRQQRRGPRTRGARSSSPTQGRRVTPQTEAHSFSNFSHFFAEFSGSFAEISGSFPNTGEVGHIRSTRTQHMFSWDSWLFCGILGGVGYFSNNRGFAATHCNALQHTIYE